MRQPALLYAARDVLESEAMGPGLLLQVHEHLLLQLILPVCDGYAVVVPAQSMLDQSGDAAHSLLTGHLIATCTVHAQPKHQ